LKETSVFKLLFEEFSAQLKYSIEGLYLRDSYHSAAMDLHASNIIEIVLEISICGF